MPICFHVVPDPAAISSMANEQDLGVGEPVVDAVLVGVLGLDQHADEVVRAARSRRAAMIGSRIPNDARRVAHQELADDQRLLDVDAEAPGDGEHGDGGGEVDVELGAPVVDELIDERVAVCSIQLLIHHCALAGTNDGCTSAR